MPEPKRAPSSAPLDVASDRMAELLRRADGLLVEWSEFGAAVQAQVEREASQIGQAVVDATELAVRRAAAESTARAIADQLGKQLAALSAEVGKLETRARAASRAIAEHRHGDRKLLYGLAGAMLIANVLLVGLLLRAQPAPVIVAEPVPVATPIAPVAETAPRVEDAHAPAPTPAGDLPRTPPANGSSGASASTMPADRGGDPAPGEKPATASEVKPASAATTGSAAKLPAHLTTSTKAPPKPGKAISGTVKSNKVRHGPPSGTSGR